MTTRRKLLYACLTTAVFLALVEGAARLIWMRLEARAFRERQARGEAMVGHSAVNFIRMPHGIYGWTLRPNSHEGDVFINAQGFHQRDTVRLERRPGFLRVICLGESTTFGSSIERTHQNSYPSYLRRILETNGHGFEGYEVINAGVPGWVSDQIALRAEHELSAYRPDTVILYVGWNDFQFYDPLSPAPAISYFEHQYGRAIWKQYAAHWLKSVALLSGLYHSRTVPAPTLHAAGPASPEELYRFLIANLDRIVTAFRKTNPATKIFVCTLVGRWPKGKPEDWAGTPTLAWISQHNVTLEQAAAYVEAMNNQLSRFARIRSLPLIDAAGAFEDLDRPRLIWDWSHMYPEGYELLAWTMFDELRREGVLEGQPGSRYAELRAKYRLVSQRVRAPE